MKKTNILLITILVFSTSSCTRIAMKLYGVKQPQKENVESINAYLIKLGADTSNSYLVKPEEYKNVVNAIDKSVPNAIFFNSNGESIEYHPNGSKCDGFVLPFIQNFKADSVYVINDMMTFNSFSEKLQNKTQFKDQFANPPLLVIFWMKAIGSLNKTFVKKWDEEAKLRGIAVVKINLDLQEDWTEEQLKKHNEPVKN